MRHYLVDRIVELVPNVRAVGVKAISLSDDVFNDHFPGNPVYPGVFLLEGLAQTGGVLLTRSEEERRVAVMVSIERARFRGFARPGDSVRLEVELESRDADLARLLGTATVGEGGGRQVAAARFTFKLVEIGRLIPPAYQPFWRQTLSIWHGEYEEIDDE